jgi:serine phosphatase RsbU (regulator of sigma subunit)/anti-sigma regulatory factor (Ser/Thr protein kinase)
MLSTPPSVFETVSSQLISIDGVTAVEISSGRRSKLYGKPEGEPQFRASLGTNISASIWGKELAAIEAIIELAKVVELREQEIADLAEALTEANDRQLRLYELAGITIDVLDHGETVTTMLSLGVKLLNAQEAALVSSTGFIDVHRVDQCLTSAQGENNHEQWLVDLATKALGGAKFVRSICSHGSYSLLNRFSVGDQEYVLAIGRRGIAFGTPERKIMDALSGTLAASLLVVALHESTVSQAVIEGEHATAAKLAADVLPTNLPHAVGIDYFATTTPARLVGGDFYTAVVHEGILRFAVGDVTGKGLPAAILMTNAITVSNLVFRRNHGDSAMDLLIEIASGLDSLLLGSSRFITMLVGTAVTDPTTGNVHISLVNAGHSPVLLLSNGVVHTVAPMTPPVGVTVPQAGTPFCTVLVPGDILFVGSDGLSEQENAVGDMFGDAAVAALLTSFGTARDQVQRVLSAVDTHAGDEARHDDQTVLVLRPDAPMVLSYPRHRQLDSLDPLDPIDLQDPLAQEFQEHQEHQDQRGLTVKNILHRLEFDAADLLTLRQIGPWLSATLPSLLDEETIRVEMPKIELALQEICVNIVQHAYQHIPGRITLGIGSSSGSVDVTITDNGAPFDPAEISEPDPANPTIRGYGLMITRQLTSSLSYRQSPTGNQWDLSFSVPDRGLELPELSPVSTRKGPFQ